ncbi:hypothetical protein IX317_000605 [Fusobacterium sp. DD29]|uniref:hypothetical protein n=1 Tax=unclassified Fusobacterium TaxID=2648384 RepID=UPI001B8C3C54|nr:MULTISPECIES: hypothetical protein [unclassified Fusobacterium]MBR8700273.1 hypothetical protein [Fusobacterium sp. DD45]MBR8710472.1 hypothetical protein [Fusobacterium sp. DD28]MBR8748944.1 hypothetical protein [Fusobacterium sp. DD29]MBR8751078.1 hypothetical protein [Fusobacterium sp. DD26]MBR8761250.1 hypothetical protein [Fusobacterium sp. DD25]
MNKTHEMKKEFKTELKLTILVKDGTLNVNFGAGGDIESTDNQAKEFRNIMLHAISEKLGYSESFVNEFIGYLDEDCKITKSVIKK